MKEDPAITPDAGTLTEAQSELPKRHWLVVVLAASISGAMAATCYWPLDWHFLAWIALVPWFCTLPGLSPGRTWVFGTLMGLVFYRIGFDWMFGLHGPLAGASIVGFAILMGYSFRVARMLMQRFGTGAMLWAAPLCFVGQEVLRSEGLDRFRFSYLGLGYSQSENLWIAQVASIGGVYCVSFLLVALNAAIAYGLIRRRARSWVPAAATGVCIVALAAITQPPADDGAARIPVACVQGEDLAYQKFLDMTAEAAKGTPKPRIIVLPEHTITGFADDRHPTVKSLAALAVEHGVYICVGVHVRPTEPGGCDYDNAALLIDPNGEIAATQLKAVPVPLFNDGNPARDQPVVATPFGRIGTYICYDGTFTDVPRRLANGGSELLLAPLMDPEPWPLQQRWQHAAMAPFRSIELRRDAVRAASSGVSQIVDATGRVQCERGRAAGPGVLRGSVSAHDARTLFSRGGYLFAPVVATAFLACVVILTLVQLRDRRRGR